MNVHFDRALIRDAGNALVAWSSADTSDAMDRRAAGATALARVFGEDVRCDRSTGYTTERWGLVLSWATTDEQLTEAADSLVHVAREPVDIQLARGAEDAGGVADPRGRVGGTCEAVAAMKIGSLFSGIGGLAECAEVARAVVADGASLAEVKR